jgi:hypothetical protein
MLTHDCLAVAWCGVQGRRGTAGHRQRGERRRRSVLHTLLQRVLWRIPSPEA